MDSLATFLHMGGHGGFIWAAFGATAIVMIGLLVMTLRAVRERQAILDALQQTIRDKRGELSGEA